MKNLNFGLTNICMEYDTVSDMTLSKHTADSYALGTYYLYNYITHFKTVEISEESNIFNTNINIHRRSMTGMLVIFKSEQENGKRDSELFPNPGILSVDISIEGIANKVYAQDLKPYYQWSEVKKYFLTEEQKKFDNTDMSECNYYHNKCALWVDLRSTQGNNINGSGLRLANTKHGVQMQIIYKTLHNNYKAHIFIIADAQLNIRNSQLDSVTFKKYNGMVGLAEIMDSREI